MFLSFFFISLLSSSATTTQARRRILHQPFFPLESLPPSPPPSPAPLALSSSLPPQPTPSNPKYPFSSTTPDQSPFFPTYPSPPPPPSPSSFASFPANISSLILPQTPKPKSSSKLFSIAIGTVVSAAVVVGISLFFYCRRRRRYDSSDKTHSYEDSSRLFSNSVENTNNNSGARKVRASSSTTSEFLYLGTIINSRGIDDLPVARNDGGGAGNSSRSDGLGLDPRKMDSPELQPLPPLARRTSTLLGGNADVSSTGAIEEEFYSPRGSMGERESSSGIGSGSRRVFSATIGENFGLRNSDSSSMSGSSSTSGSPVRSHSVSLSPPVSLSPRRSQSKSPESTAVCGQQSSIPLEPQLIEKQRHISPSPLSTPERNPEGSPRISLVPQQIVHSPSLSSLSSTPGRGFGVNGQSSSPSPSPPASPDRLLQKCYELSSTLARERVCNASDQRKLSSFSSSTSSPERFVEKNLYASSPKISNASERCGKSVLSSPVFSLSLLSSPERGWEKNLLQSPGVPNVSDQKMVFLLSSPSSSPEGEINKGLDQSPRMSSVADQMVQSPERNVNSLLQTSIVSAPPPPPPPPPPFNPLPHRQWEPQTPTTPADQPISRPPELKPPSRPFVLQTPTKVSPVELPPSAENVEIFYETSKPKLKPLHWDKVRARSDREMVWDHLRSNSFILNEEMIETLFVVNTPNPNPNPKETVPRSVLPLQNQETRVLDPKKAQNISILLRALNVTIKEVCDALLEGNADTLGTELLESLLKMAPTIEEECKLKEYKDDSPMKLGPAEKFLKAVLDIPFAFKRVDVMLYIANFESEVEYLRKSFETLEFACQELRNSRMFLKLLEAVLKTGNRMNVGTNRGDAQAFKLDTLLKLVDVKGADGKTTLLHFVVQEIIRTEGAQFSGVNQTPNPGLNEDVMCRKLGLQIVSGLSSELTNVKKAAAMDSEVLINEVSKLSRGIPVIAAVVHLNEAIRLNESNRTFSESMNKFVRMAEGEILKIQALEKQTSFLVKEITEYFHGNLAKEEAHPFRIFMVVGDFLNVLDKVCKEVGMLKGRPTLSSAHRIPVPVNPMVPQPMPGLYGKRNNSFSDDESASP